MIFPALSRLDGGTMSKLTSQFASPIEAMLEYRAALGLSESTLNASLIKFDRYCSEHYPDCSVLTKELALEWLSVRGSGSVSGDASAIRQFSRYLTAIGQEAYVLPDGFYSAKSTFMPYIFSDIELSMFFRAADALPDRGKTNEVVIAPVLFRLIYTCGLRPNEGRELLRENVNLSSGEMLITKTKWKKERTVVMSADMLSLCNKYDARLSPEREYFFPRCDGEPYTTTQADRLFKKCWKTANPGVTGLPNVRIYDLRHRFASARLNRWLDEKRDLNAMLPYLSAYMGHKTISETAYYVHIMPENLVKSAGVDWKSLNALLPEVNV